MCIPASKTSMNGLGICFVLNGVMQCMTATFYQSENCKQLDDMMEEEEDTLAEEAVSQTSTWCSALQGRYCTWLPAGYSTFLTSLHHRQAVQPPRVAMIRWRYTRGRPRPSHLIQRRA